MIQQIELWIAKCDLCGTHEGSPVLSKGQAELLAQNAGWIVGTDGQAVCRECKPFLKKPATAAGIPAS